MKERRGWTKAEDEVLRLLREQRNQNKWSAIAAIMQLQFDIPGKTGKQCRERYYNHLQSSISHADWLPHEDQLLLTLHSEFGNKWSNIAQKLPGRTQNCVKNHFYSKLRKVIRKLNRTAGLAETNSSPPSLPLLSRIIATSECKFQLNSPISEEWIAFASVLIGKLYNLEVEGPQYRDAEQELLKDLAYFEHNFKKRKCNKRNSSEDAYCNRRTKNKIDQYASKRCHKDKEEAEEDNCKAEQMACKEEEVLDGILVPGLLTPLIKEYRPNPIKLCTMGEGSSPFSPSALSLGMIQPLQLSECLIKPTTSTFNSFCELQQWQRVKMLEQSEQYAMHYSTEPL